MKKVFLLLTVVALTFVGCNDDDSQAGLVGPNNSYVGFATKTQISSLNTALATADVTVPVSLVSYQNEEFPDYDIDVVWKLLTPEEYLSTVSFESEDAYNAELASFGTIGTEFDIPNGTSGSVTIPAGSGFVNLPNIVAYPQTLDPAFPKKFAIYLESASNGAVVAEQYRYIVVTLQGVCVSELEGMYDLVVTITAGNGVGSVYDLPGEELSKLSDTQYSGTSIGPYNSRGLISANAQIGGVGLVFDDVCGSIALWQDPDWNYSAQTGVPDGTAQFLGPYYNAVYQTSAQVGNSYVTDTDGIYIEYNIWFSAGTRSYSAIYTPQ